MKCPKCKEILEPRSLFESLTSQACPTCQGQWVDGDDYPVWRQTQTRPLVDPMRVLRANLGTYQVPAALDTKAGLCPHCQKILSRTRIPTRPFFYLEQCLACNGIWFDTDEADILQQLQLHDRIEQLGTPAWQSQVRAAQMLLSEQEALLEKMGIDIAQQVLELADMLKDHPHGDFAAAYLVRRFERDA